MANKVFDVQIHYAKGGHEVETVIAKNDVEAREKAIKRDMAHYKGWAKSDIPTVAYCETRHVRDLS